VNPGTGAAARTASDDERSEIERHVGRACPVLLVAAAAVFGWIFADYGITWDEGVQSTYGELVLDYFASAGKDSRCNEFSNLFYYGSLFESAAAAAYRMVGDWKYEIRHAAIGLAAFLTVVAVWRFGRLFDCRIVSFFAVLALLMMPRFIGHAFNNSKDIPFACGFAWGMVGIARLLVRRTWAWSEVWLCGAAIGLALSVRAGALLLLILLAMGIAASLVVLPGERQRWREASFGRAAKAAAIVGIAWTIMVLSWPWAQGGPLTRPFEAMAEMSGFSFAYTTYFAGEFMRSDSLPHHYLPFYLAIVTPLVTSIGAVAGLLAAVWTRLARGRDAIPTALVASWVSLPLAYVVALRPNVYDGIRHFLFVLPAVALLAGLGVAWVLERCGRRWKTPVLILLALAFVLPLRDMVLLHPYQSSYFNTLVGGVGQAWRRYDTDYWASSYREAVEWVRRQIAAQGDEEATIVVACNENNRPCAEYYLRGGAEPNRSTSRVSMHCIWEGHEEVPDDAMYYVAMLRYGKASAFFPDWPVVHVIGREGAVFSVVKRNPRLSLAGGAVSQRRTRERACSASFRSRWTCSSDGFSLKALSKAEIASS